MSGVREILEQIRSELRDHVQNGWKFTLDAEEGAVVLAALDAEGVGLKGEIRRFADEMYDCKTVTSQAMHRVCQDLLTRWEGRRWSIPLPGQSPDLPATDALYGFAAWLTCREEPVTLGANHDAAPAAELVARFRESQGLPELSDAYPGNLKPYPLSGQSGAKPDECSLCSGRGVVNSCDEAGVTSVCPRCDQTGAEPAPSAGLREALEWYAEQTRDCRKMGRDGDRARQALDADGGARALAALNADEEQSNEQ